MKMIQSQNELGTPITIIKCEVCEEQYSICPAIHEYEFEQIEDNFICSCTKESI